MDRIRSYFEKSFAITDKDWQFFSSKLVRQEFPKRHLLVKAGETEDYLSFVESGIIRLYIPKEENDLTFGIVFDGEFVSAYDSFLTRQPSVYEVETHTECVLWRITYNDLQSVYTYTASGNHIGRLAGEAQFLKKNKRELSFLNDTPTERYLKLFTERPDMIQQIPLKYIASYIGVTPQALSRIRSRIY